MRKVLIAAVVVAILVIGFFVYRSCGTGKNLNVEPHARKEIEKAKGR